MSEVGEARVKSPLVVFLGKTVGASLAEERISPVARATMTPALRALLRARSWIPMGRAAARAGTSRGLVLPVSQERSGGIT